jgi:hypothetical protein
MKLIILTGASDKGKSRTLNLSFNALINFGYTRFQNHFRTLGNPIQNDFIDIVERNNYRIGFATMGDYKILQIYLVILYKNYLLICKTNNATVLYWLAIVI